MFKILDNGNVIDYKANTKGYYKNEKSYHLKCPYCGHMYTFNSYRIIDLHYCSCGCGKYFSIEQGAVII